MSLRLTPIFWMVRDRVVDEGLLAFVVEQQRHPLASSTSRPPRKHGPTLIQIVEHLERFGLSGSGFFAAARPDAAGLADRLRALGSGRRCGFKIEAQTRGSAQLAANVVMRRNVFISPPGVDLV
jgi:hypothetical protein